MTLCVCLFALKYKHPLLMRNTKIIPDYFKRRGWGGGGDAWLVVCTGVHGWLCAWVCKADGVYRGHSAGRGCAIELFATATRCRKQAGSSYFVTSHQAQVSQRLAALCNQGGSLIRDFFTPSDVHSLYGHTVSANGYQCCRGKGERALALAG